MNRFATALRNYRKARGLRQGDAARLAGLSQATYCKIELGNCSPRLSTAERVATSLGTSLAELLASAAGLAEAPDFEI